MLQCEVHLQHSITGLAVPSNRQMTEQEQEVDPGWFGSKLMRGFQSQADPRQRLLAARQARPHATINAHTMKALRAAQVAGQVSIWESWEVTSARVHPSDSQAPVMSDDEVSSIKHAAKDGQALGPASCSSSVNGSAASGHNDGGPANLGQAGYLESPPGANDDVEMDKAARHAHPAHEPQSDHVAGPGQSASGQGQASAASPDVTGCQPWDSSKGAPGCSDACRQPQHSAEAAAGSCWKLQVERCRTKASHHQDGKVSTAT